MAVLVDTSVLVGAFSHADPLHERSTALLRELASGQKGRLLVTDSVLSEALTLLRARPGNAKLSRLVCDAVLKAGAFRVHWTDEATSRDAVALHFKHYDRKMSVVDCSLVALAQRMGWSVATFDQQFNGLVDVVA